MIQSDPPQLNQALGSSELLSGVAAQLFDYWYEYLCRVLSVFYQTQLRAPCIIASDYIGRCGYIDHFPNQTMRAQNGLQPDTAYYLTPSACFHLYPQLAGTQLRSDLSSYLIVAPCARYEGGMTNLPFRRRSFTMLELVVIGEPANLIRRRDELVELVSTTFASLGLRGSFKTATDAFFLPENAGAKLMQQLKETKREYQVQSGDTTAALASLNYHERHFTSSFAIGTGTTESMCLAFGLERLVAHSLSQWGEDPANWPIC